MTGLLIAAVIAQDSLVVQVGPETPDTTCLKCHGMPGFGYPGHDMFIDYQAFKNSPHSFNSCTKCHTEITSIPHGHVSPPQCQQCHEKQFQEFQGSVHQQAGVTCTDCHNPHWPGGFKGQSVVSGVSTCESCHQGVEASHANRFPYAEAHMASLSCQACHAVASFHGDFAFAKRESDNRLTPYTVIRKGDTALIRPVSAHTIYKGTAVNDCQQCHSGNSLLYRDITMDFHPVSIKAEGVVGQLPITGGRIQSAGTDRAYPLGSRIWLWLDIIGGLMLVGTLFGAAGHGALRWLAGLRRRRSK